MPGHNGGANWAGSAVDPINGEFYIVSKNLPVMLRMELTNEEPSARTVQGPVVSREEAAAARAAAQAAAAQGPVRYQAPYDFMLSPTNGMSPMGPPFSHLTAYDLNTGEIKWRVPNGGTAGIGADVGAHFPRGAPLVTAGGLLFVATAQDRQLRAYDRDNGKVLWSYTLPGGSEGIPDHLRAWRPAVPRGTGGSRRGLVRAAPEPGAELPPLDALVRRVRATQRLGTSLGAGVTVSVQPNRNAGTS